MLNLLRYYAANLLHSRIKGPLNRRAVAQSVSIWEALRAAHPKSESMLVVCNGPSLLPRDLELLDWMPSIASNKIALLFDRTKWRPQYFTICDPLLAFKLRNDPFDAYERVLCSHNVFGFFRGVRPLPWRIVRYEQADDQARSGQYVPDPIRGFLDGYSITVYNIQLAMWLGARRIYLIGCDHSYAEQRRAGVAKLAHGDVSNHFDPRYRSKGEIVNNAPIERMELAFATLQRMAAYNGVHITNISRRSALEVFDRASVEDVLAMREART